MRIKNANLWNGEKFVLCAMRIEEGKFAVIAEGQHDCAQAVDFGGDYVIPGLIDIHSHGNSGADFSDGDYEGLVTMAKYLVKRGVTSFAPASMTLPYDVLSSAYATAKRIVEEDPADASRLLGINMEGPFFSEKKKGAQNGEYLKLPDFDAFKKLYDDCGGLIRICDIAPELPGAVEFIEKASKLCTVSIGHTDAGYDAAAAGVKAGVTHLTHLFNGMPSLHHRNPGVIPAASESGKVYAEIICDGLHVHPAMVRLAFSLFPGKICIISDALRCAGMPEGEYMLGGQKVYLKGTLARLADGTIAGSASTLADCFKNALSFGISQKEVINACTINPARQLGAADKVGSIEVGKYADFIRCDKELNFLEIYKEGNKI